MSKRIGFLGLIGAMAIGCTSAPTAGPGVLPDGGRPLIAGVALPQEQAEARGVLLLLSDRRTYDPAAVALALEGDAETRRQLALALGRIGDPRGAVVLERLLSDSEDDVRHTAIFGLGLLGARESAAALLPLLSREDREAAVLAVEALARMGARLDAVVENLLLGETDELLPRLAPALWRFDDPKVVRWAEQGLEEDDPEVRAMSAYALARPAHEEGRDLLRVLLEDPDPWVRGWSARALGRLGDATDLDRLRPLLEDPEPGPAVQALRAARRLFDAGEAAAPADWIPRLIELSRSEDAGVRATALEVAGGWSGSPALAAALLEIARGGEPREKQLAILSLAEGRDAHAAALLVRLRTDPNPALREVAAQAAGFLGAFEILDDLIEDRSPRVRIAALETICLARTEEREHRLRTAIQDPDPAVRATALDLLVETPLLPVQDLAEGFALQWRDRLPDPRLAGIRALVARAEAEPLERGPILDELRRLTLDAEISVRRAAGGALEELGEKAPELGPAMGRKTAAVYVDIARRTAARRAVEIETERGVLKVELACSDAPSTCLNFLQLVGQGFYDGLEFHRVVPRFVAQGGDPRGDGWGGPGYTLRDEPSLRRYDRGVIGLALSASDTGGSQFFVTLERQPHLDGAYPVLGWVVEGDDVLDRLLQGDQILRVVETQL